MSNQSFIRLIERNPRVKDVLSAGTIEISSSSLVWHVRAGEDVRVRDDCHVLGSPDCPIQLGDRVYINRGCTLQGMSAPLVLGNRVTLAIGVIIQTDSGPNTSPLLQAYYPIQSGPVIIEDDVWLGNRVTIAPGVRIGHGSVVGAHAYVREDIPSGVVVAGVPARIIYRLEDGEKLSPAVLAQVHSD